MGYGREELNRITSEQKEFILKETGYSLEDIDNMEHDELAKFEESMADIEIEEELKAEDNGSDISPRGDMAADIQTILTMPS